MFQAAFALAHPQIVNNDLNTSTHNVASQLRLAAGHGDLALFERGQLEAVQLPWTPTLARSSTYGADLRLPDVQLERGTLSSQQVRYALLRGAISDAVSNFEQLTECLESVEALHAAIEPGRSEFAQVASDKMQTMWAGSFVRLLSATLQQQDLRTSTYVVEVALEGLGSKYVGQQAVKRLFIAACSPKFYDQPQMPPRRSVAPVILHQPFVRVMRIIRSWAEDVRLQDRNMMQSVADADMTSKQRLRSVLSRGNSSLAFARAMAMCLVPALFANGFGDTWFIQHQSFQNVDPTEVMQEALATMLALHVNCNLVRWWQQVERETEAQMDVWRISMHEVTRFKEQSRIMAMMCNRAEAERVAKVQQHRA